TMTADDIDFSTQPRAVSFPFVTQRYASEPGWDQYYGYGRANAHGATEAVANGDVPPEADLLAPDWWETIDPVRTPVVSVTGSAAASRASGFSYELAFGCGVQPTEARMNPIANTTGLNAPLVDVTLGNWRVADAANTCAFDPAATAESAPSGTGSPNDTPDTFTVTLRLRVTDNAGRRAEARRTVYLHHDRDLVL